MVKSQLEAERFPGKVADAPMRAFHELTEEEQATMIKKRLKDYANKVPSLLDICGEGIVSICGSYVEKDSCPYVVHVSN